MIIYSWNVLRSNKHPEKVLKYIEHLEFDILCLQEVTEEMLTELKKMPYNIAYNVDRISEVLHIFSQGKTSEKVVNYAVILSRYEIKAQGKVQFPPLMRSFNSRAFELFMESIQTWESVTNLGAVYADFVIEGRPVRVFCVHLALWNPKTRANEFEHLMEYLPENGAAIVCGDFNILEYGPIKILNWFLSGSLYEGMPWYPERRLFEERFEKYHLTNQLLGHITHSFSRSQLDHILLSSDFRCNTLQVIKESHGSDHQPIMVEALFT